MELVMIQKISDYKEEVTKFRNELEGGWSSPDVILMRKRLTESNSQQVAQEGRN